jgi:hypothetical protein
MTLHQVADVEHEALRPLLEAISASLAVASAEPTTWPPGMFGS